MASKADKCDRPARVLYITYDGLTDPLGRSQILPYLGGLAARSHEITILSCEKPDRMAKDGARIQQICNNMGLSWLPLKYHKKPPIVSSALDAVALKRAAIRLHRERRFDIAHCRSYIPAWAGLVLKRRLGVKLLVDMRGFWPDEKVEGNNWNLGNPLYRSVYHFFKRLESGLLKGADHIISLTEAGRKQLLTRPELAGDPAPITVIPCCVDFSHFPLATQDAREAVRQRLGIEDDEPVLAYLGSLGSWYMRDEMLDFFKVYASRFKPARFLFVTPDAPQPIRAAAFARGIDPDRLIVLSATREEVPELMSGADLGIFLIKPVFSKTASSPTKMGEMLALGLPIVTNAGVGDVEEMVGAMGCGVAIRHFSPESYAKALDELALQNQSSEERRKRALPWFDVELGIERYNRVYRELLG